MKEKLEKLTELGLSLTSIAKGVGITKQAISKWYLGESVPSAANEEKFNKWLRLFKETVSQL